MKRLAEKIKRNGFIYLQVHRTNEVAIYLQYAGTSKIGFEVFEIVRKKETRFKDVVIPAREKFPSNTDFGNSAFSIGGLNRAIARASQIQRKVLKRTDSNAPNYFERLLNSPQKG